MPDWLLIVLLLGILCIVARILRKQTAIDEHTLEHLARKVAHTENQLKGAIMSVQDDVNAVTAQVKKGTAEVVGKIEELQAQIDAGQTPDLTDLRAAAQALDSIVPDAPADAPAADEPAPAADEPAADAPADPAV